MHEHLIIIVESSAEWHKKVFVVLFIVFWAGGCTNELQRFSRCLI